MLFMEGTGMRPYRISLTVIRRILDRHDGSIRATSEYETGETGTTFHVSLPTTHSWGGGAE